MSLISRTSLTAVLCAAATGALCTPVFAQETTATYVVTSVSQSANGQSVLVEVLSLERDGDHSRLRVAGGDGSMFIVPVALTVQGQIDSTSQDRSVTCYNMAMGVLAHAGTNDDPAPVLAQFYSSVVPIPLFVRATREQGPLRTLAFGGTTSGVLHTGETANDAGIVVTATVGERNGTLHDATFDEVTYLGTPARPLGRSTCTLTRAERPAAAAAQT